MITPHSPGIWALRHDWRDLCEVVTLNAFAANFLPSERRVCGWLYRGLSWLPAYKLALFVHFLMLGYNFLIAMVAFFALNWRQRPISLDAIKFDEFQQ